MLYSQGLEDETGSVNVIVWKSQREWQHAELFKSRLMALYGESRRYTENEGQMRHLATQSREFH